MGLQNHNCPAPPAAPAPPSRGRGSRRQALVRRMEPFLIVRIPDSSAVQFRWVDVESRLIAGSDCTGARNIFPTSCKCCDLGMPEYCTCAQASMRMDAETQSGPQVLGYR